MYTIEYAASVSDDLSELTARDRVTILDRIEQQLTDEPARTTRSKKIIEGLQPPWEHEPPTWQLRVGEFRIFYDVNETNMRVVVRAIRHKPPHKTTEEIL
jgi:mRNA-degrading endonuclease RelE of RelBE toxin-antitoxin system